MVQLQTYILLLLPLVVVGQTNKTDNHRAEKALSVFTVVKVTKLLLRLLFLGNRLKTFIFALFSFCNLRGEFQSPEPFLER